MTRFCSSFLWVRMAAISIPGLSVSCSPGAHPVLSIVFTSSQDSLRTWAAWLMLSDNWDSSIKNDPSEDHHQKSGFKKVIVWYLKMVDLPPTSGNFFRGKMMINQWIWGVNSPGYLQTPFLSSQASKKWDKLRMKWNHQIWIQTASKSSFEPWFEVVARLFLLVHRCTQ